MPKSNPLADIVSFWIDVIESDATAEPIGVGDFVEVVTNDTISGRVVWTNGNDDDETTRLVNFVVTRSDEDGEYTTYVQRTAVELRKIDEPVDVLELEEYVGRAIEWTHPTLDVVITSEIIAATDNLSGFDGDFLITDYTAYSRHGAPAVAVVNLATDSVRVVR